MQPPGAQGSAAGAAAGAAGAQQQPSMHDMQRLRQQLQAQAQFRQQQLLQQQQQPQQQQFPGSQLNFAALQQQQQPAGMPGNSAMNLAMMQQNSLGNSNSTSNPGLSSSAPGSNSALGNNANAANANMVMQAGNNAFRNWPALQQQQQQPQGGGGTTSTMDATQGSSAQLMAMANMAGMGSAANFASAMPQFNSNASGGGSATSSTTLQNMQAVLLQRQQQQQQQQAAKMGGTQLGQQQQQPQGMSAMSGLSANFNAAQQQAAATALQQQQQQNKSANNSSTNMQGLMQGDKPSGGNAGSNNAPQQNQQPPQHLLLQQQLAALQKQQQMVGGGGAGASSGSIATNAAMAAIQSNMQQKQHGNSNSVSQPQQQQQKPGGMPGTPGQSALQVLTPQHGMSQQQLLQLHQQQLLQQMQQQPQQQQQQRNSSSGSSNNSGGMMQQLQQQRTTNQALLQQMAGNANGMTNFAQQQQQQSQLSGMGQQQSYAQSQQQQIQMQQSGGSDNSMNMMGANLQQQIMRSRSSGLSGSMRASSHGTSNGDQPQNFNDNASIHSNTDNNNMGDNASVHSSQPQQQQQQSSNSQDAGSVASCDQKSFLGGRFAGGWQSNADLPDRRRVIFNILEVIRQMRPDTSKLSNKLPHMAKSLEEHLYRSAKSKEDYMNLSTLKKRLQAIAHGLEIHRSSDATGMKGPDGTLPLQDSATHNSSLGGNQNSVGIELAQNPSWSMVAAARSGVSGNASLNGLAAQLNSGGSLSMVSQLQQLQQGVSGGLGGSQHGDMVPNQASVNSVANQQHAGSPASFSPPQQLQNSFLASKQFALQQQLQQGSGIQLSQHSVANGMGQTGIAGQNTPSAQASGFPGNAGENVGGQLPQQLNEFQSNDSSSQSAGNASFPNMGAQKKRVILQQQQRLLLLRHASKCTAGKNCTTKFCEQMVTLWKHMKECRNKNCKTNHCLSSRCVLNHYRICKSNGRTWTCEVCGPVMLKIKQQERDDGNTDDPLTRDQDSSPQPQLPAAPPVAAAAVTVNQSPAPSDKAQNQQAQVQAQQSKLKDLIESLKLLRKQQEQLFEQQKSLEQQAQHIGDPNSAEARQLQEQQMLIQQLQKRCQQQQLLLEQELQMQTTKAAAAVAARATPNNQAQQLKTAASLGAAKGAAPISAPKATRVQGAQRRRGSGKGKRFAKPIGLQPTRQTSDEQSTKKKRGSATKKDGPAKKPKATPPAPPDPVPAPPEEKNKAEADTPGAPANKTEDDHFSQLSCMTKEEIQKHLESLNKRIILSSRTITHKCRPVLQDLLDDQFAWVFRDAVDPVALGLPDYFDVIKNPMHLELVKKKLENAIYSDMEHFARDVRLVFENAILYNGESSEVGELAQTLLTSFNKSYSAMVREIESSHLNLESQGELCSLCGVQRRRFEPTVLYCQGRCGMLRIKRNATYYTDRTKRNHWCSSCYESLNSVDPILLDDGATVQKKELQEFKNDALPEEGWVNCDDCHSWVHQVCALFNGRTNKSNARYCCPTCYLNKPEVGDTSTIEIAKKKTKSAGDLSRCKMSDVIESGLQNALQGAYSTRAAELGLSIDEVEKVDGLCVRVLSNVDKKHFVGEQMLQRYASKGCPSEFPVRTKCIALFQKIHGVDTLLFSMYVYEYGQDCPAPNKRRVYISYLDSVQYFEPKCYRTTAYHAIIIEYLRYVKKRGFHTAHIWSCPPTPGDDYIFYCHPKHQLVPREDMLRSWYHRMLDQAKAQGVIIRTTTLHDEYFSNDTVNPVPGQRHDPTCLPYFEGDYIPGEIENIIETDGKKCSSTSSSRSDKDNVMARIGHNLSKMKDNFIVVHLRNRGFAAAVERGEDVSQWKEDSDDDMVKSKRAKISGKFTSVGIKEEASHAAGKVESNLEMKGGALTPVEDETVKLETGVGSKPEIDHSSGTASQQPDTPGAVSSEAQKSGSESFLKHTEESESIDNAAGLATSSADAKEPAMFESESSVARPVDGGIEPKSRDLDVADEEHATSLSAEKGMPVDGVMSDNATEAKDKTNTENTSSPKRALEEIKPAISRHLSELSRSGSPVGDTVDEDEPVESEMFESRQLFLNYCQTTHCQFDELRRAKHSTLMVLFQLHNPMAPKFLQQCGACYRDITHGIRYHCNYCSNFDLCEDCYEPVTSGEWAKRDSRFAHNLDHKFSAIDMEATEETQKSRAERMKSLKAHIELLEHAASCAGPPSCSLHNCQRLKKLFLHVPTCDVKPKKDCKVCTRLLALGTVHSRMCTARQSCAIPFCDRIRERNKRLRRQQKLMDDRRRQAQNELYRAG